MRPFSNSSQAGGYDDPRWWRPDDWAWVRSRWDRDTRSSGNSTTARLVLARDVRPACRCRCRGRSTSVRPRRRRTHDGAARGCRPKRSSSARPTARRRAAAKAAIRGASDEPSAEHGAFDFVELGSASGRQPSGRPQRLGHRRSRRQRLGVDEHRRSRRFPVSPSSRRYPEYSADFFDGEHFVMKGASPATARSRCSVRRSATGFARDIPYVYATLPLCEER